MSYHSSKGQESQTNENEDLEPIDFDAILPELGQFGLYQKLVYLYLLFPVIFNSIYTYQYIFNAGAVAYRCRVPQCEASPEKFATNGWGKFALPVTGYDCWRRLPIGEKCEPASFGNGSTLCYSWVYENHDTIVSEFDLACKDWKRTLVGTINSAGVFFAMPTSAAVSDAFGRRFVLIFTSVAPAVFGVARSFCDNYIVYLVLEFLHSLFGKGAYSTAFIIALEVVGLNKRVLGGNLISCMYSIGMGINGLTAWAIPHWRSYTITIFAPSFIFIFYSFFVDESVRWLIARGKRDKAVKIIFKIARINGVTLSPDTIKLLNQGQSKKKVLGISALPKFFFEQEHKKPSIIKQVLASRIILTRVAVVSFWWVSSAMMFYGLTINAVSLKGNKYVNFIMTSLVDIPGCLLSYLTLDRFGRKSTIMTCYFACALSLLVLPAIDNPNIVIFLTLVGKMMSSLIFTGIYIYTIELFPTQARHVLMGSCSMIGRIGSMAAPQTPLLMVYHKSLPYVVFGSLAFCAGMLMLFTPETLHMKLPNTVEQAEEMSMLARSSKKNVTNLIT